ncbi:MAG: thermonuclease family protein [Solidesulfovibrio sp. DCME]|uniref:thermonuclease family protein n=1 Tax=Solidesulfovibrio sp. DCME TaxID=3447380 RepID=UPI003D11C3AB
MVRFPRVLPFAVVRIACLGLAALSLTVPSLDAGGRDYGSVGAVVVRVCDGDTVVVDIPDYPAVMGQGIRVRLSGVNAPELRAENPVEREAARRAREAMERLLPPGTPVTLSGIRRDKYFRLDAAVRVDGRDAADALGLAASPQAAP